jgi:hypothetical protein
MIGHFDVIQCIDTEVQRVIVEFVYLYTLEPLRYAIKRRIKGKSAVQKLCL